MESVSVKRVYGDKNVLVQEIYYYCIYKILVLYIFRLIERGGISSFIETSLSLQSTVLSAFLQ